MHDHHHHHDDDDHDHAHLGAGPHDHVFLGHDHDRNARRTWAVIVITGTMMVAEIAAGIMFGSMALLADGWHMATHAGALMITALAYRIARRQSGNSRFTFGTGKIGDLGAFASAVILGVVALLIGWESVVRLMAPVAINFGQATVVAVIGLAVNLGSALLLHQGHDHGHAHDNNLRAAYLHVLADALTSVLAIAALVAGSVMGWVWLDPVIGVLGALVIARWSFGLMRQAGAVLVDYRPADALPEAIRRALTVDGDEITDLHVWQLGPGHHGAIVALHSTLPEAPDRYRARLAHLGLSHVTVEVSAG